MQPPSDALQALSPLRLPPATPETLAGDAVTGLALGLCLALALALLLRVLRRAEPSERQRLMAALRRARSLPPDRRLAAQAAVLRQAAGRVGVPDHPGEDWLVALDRRLGTGFFAAGEGADLRRALYRPRPALDPGRVEDEALRLLSRLRG